MDLRFPLFHPEQEKTDDPSSLGPRSFEEYVGQESIKQKLSLYVKACKLRQEPFDHLLLFGPPGLGKTTLATIMAHELGVLLKITTAPALERSGDLVALLTNLAPREILFIDEIHRLPRQVEEILYSAMEQFCVDMIVGQGAGAQSVRIPIAPCTIIGATTRTALISSPLQTRFGIIERLDFYEPLELAQIIFDYGKKLGTNVEKEAALLMGECSRGTPRIAKRILRRVRDVAQVEGVSVVDKECAQKALAFLGIDAYGFTDLDRLILRKIIENCAGGPTSLDTISSLTGEDKETIEIVAEPFLLRQGFLIKTPRGRVVPPAKKELLCSHLGIKLITQQPLFKQFE